VRDFSVVAVERAERLGLVEVPEDDGAVDGAAEGLFVVGGETDAGYGGSVV